MILVRDSAGVLIDDSRFEQNVTMQASTAMAALGGGLHLQVTDRGSTTIWRTEFLDNWAYGTRQAFGGGVFAQTWQRGVVGLEDVLFDGNIVAHANGEGAGFALRMRTFGTRNILVSDTLIASGRSGGVGATARGGRIHLTNLTVTAHPGAGIQTGATSGVVTLHNSIAYGNTPNLAGAPAALGSNLIGVDPLFVEAAAGDYHLSLASPAIDEGTNTPPAGLGPTDADGNRRVANGRVDAGAFERAY